MLVFQVVQGDPLTQLRTAQFTIGIHQLGNHGHLQLVQIGRGGLLVGVAGFQLALDTAKQVDLPGHVQPQVIPLTVDPFFGLARYLAFAHIAAGAAGNGRHGVIADVIANGPGRAQASKSHAQLAVTVERLRHQLVEGRIVELLPPDAFIMGPVKPLEVVGTDLCRLSDRGFVVRAYGAGTQGQHQQTWHKDFQAHCCDSSLRCLAALRASLRST